MTLLFRPASGRLPASEIGEAAWTRDFWAVARNECTQARMALLHEEWGDALDMRDAGLTPVQALVALGVEF